MSRWVIASDGRAVNLDLARVVDAENGAVSVDGTVVWRGEPDEAPHVLRALLLLHVNADERDVFTLDPAEQAEFLALPNVLEIRTAATDSEEAA